MKDAKYFLSIFPPLCPGTSGGGVRPASTFQSTLQRKILEIRAGWLSAVLVPLNLGFKQPCRRVFISPIASSGKTQVMQ